MNPLFFIIPGILIFCLILGVVLYFVLTPTGPEISPTDPVHGKNDGNGGSAGNNTPPPKKPTCESGWTLESGKCLKDCLSGYTATGSSCTRLCPDGFEDAGDSCLKPKSIKVKEYPWKFGDSYKFPNFVLDEAKARCEAAHGKDGCEKKGAIYYEKCKPPLKWLLGWCVRGCPEGMTEEEGWCIKDTIAREITDPVMK